MNRVLLRDRILWWMGGRLLIDGLKCHPERSEGSPYYNLVILRCAQDDIKALNTPSMLRVKKSNAHNVS